MGGRAGDVSGPPASPLRTMFQRNRIHSDPCDSTAVFQIRRTPVYKIAIAGASTLLGRELKEALSDSPLAAATFVLLDEAEAQGQLDQVGDEVTFVRAIDNESSDRADFTFFAGP